MELVEYKKLSKNELLERIKKASKKKNALILAHNYQRMEVQGIADHTGDSLELSRIASRTNADLIVFCGVDFMAESAKILSPGKKVLLPEIKATCPMAAMVTVEALSRTKLNNPDAIVVSYVNSSAAVKALTDVCCTSSNALKVAESLKGNKIIFVPDRNLSHYTQKMTGVEMIPWDGYCYVHNFFTVEDVRRAKKEHPEAVILIHPESPPEVVELADHVFSTSGMARFVASLPSEQKKKGVILGTETGLCQRLIKEHPDTGIWPLSEFAICGTMKMTTLDKVCWAIETENFEINIPDEIIGKARRSLERMIELG